MRGQGMEQSGRGFARTGHAMRLMERVAAAVRQREPCLLVGETGTGKTALVQQLATQASFGGLLSAGVTNGDAVVADLGRRLLALQRHPSGPQCCSDSERSNPCQWSPTHDSLCCHYLGLCKRGCCHNPAAFCRVQVGAKLVVLNLSQQTDSSDLLGGFRPVEARAALAPLLARFQELVADTWTRGRNAEFLARVARVAERRKWPQLLAAFRSALRKVCPHRSDPCSSTRRRCPSTDAAWV